jgi:hypothetical protein
VIIGLAAIVRPTALFPWIGMFLVLYSEKSWQKMFIFSLTSGLTVCLLFIFNEHFYNDILRQFHSYSTLPNVSKAVLDNLKTEGEGSHFGWPFVNLVKATFILTPPIWKIAFVWAHVIAIFVSIIIAIKNKLYQNSLEKIFFVWAFLNSLFIFSTGEFWAFYSFDRYFIWALPAYLFLIKDRVKFNKKTIIILFILSFSLAVFSSAKYFIN